MKRDDIFPSRYLKASDLKGTAIVVEIESAQQETLKNTEGKEQNKTVLAFIGKHKVLPLNITNWDAVADVTGEDDTINWPGHKIEVYPTKTQMAGKTVDCIRIRPPAQRELQKKGKTKPPSDDEMDDEVPF